MVKVNFAIGEEAPNPADRLDGTDYIVIGGNSDAVSTAYLRSLDGLWRIMLPRRMQILRALVGKAPMSQRAVARLVGHHWRTIHRDLRLLCDLCLIDETMDGLVCLPTDGLVIEIRIPAQPAHQWGDAGAARRWRALRRAQGL